VTATNPPRLMMSSPLLLGIEKFHELLVIRAF
jgi:hypothetical protein